jgi:hypothetical protein
VVKIGSGIEKINNGVPRNEKNQEMPISYPG